jgi:hypothetical protein
VFASHYAVTSPRPNPIEQLQDVQDRLNVLANELFARREEPDINALREEYPAKRQAIVGAIALPAELAGVSLASDVGAPQPYEADKDDTTPEHYIVELSEWIRQTGRDYGSTLVRTIEQG